MKYLSLFLLLFWGMGYSQNATVAGTFEYYQTINSIGFEWDISGDDNHNVQCTVRYRKQGESVWQDAMPLYRIDISGFANMLSGSIMFLNPGTTYEIELILSDADGGSGQQTPIITTRAIPQQPTGGNTYYVSPGSGGGTGTEGDPFLGISAAEAVAQPGDIFLLNSGDYGTTRIRLTSSGTSTDYMVWKAAPGATPVFQGVRIIGDYIWLEGVTVQNVDHGLLTDYTNEPEGVVVSKNTFNDCYYSINLNHGGNNWYIVDNVIVGRIDDYSTGAYGGEGVELNHSDGHVVAYNSISNTADGVSYPGRNCDIHNNEIFHVSDDGLELDFGLANVRAWNNRITNAHSNGISFQNLAGNPYGAPWYVIRNQVIVADQDAVKLRDNVDRALLAHNTFVCWEGVVSASTGKLVAFQSHNNLWISVIDRYVWEDTSPTTTTDWRTNLDYDGFDWNNNHYAFKWQNTRLTSLQELQNTFGLELNGIRVDKNLIFEQFIVPQPPTLAPFQYMTLNPGCNAVDAGIALPNINDGYDGVAPDLGAFERNSALPHYGPRTARIHARLLLQGPAFNTGSDWEMSSGLPANQSVTLTPYYDLGWDSQQTTATPLSMATDWVFVQISTRPGQSPVEEKSAFLSADGVLMDIDGTQGVTFDSEPGNYYLTIKHRNHLPVTSSAAIDLSVNSEPWDFTTAQNQSMNNSGMVELSAGRWALAAGELNHDGVLTTADYVLQHNQRNDSGYISGDLDFDGDVDSADRNLWMENALLDVQ